MIRQDSPRIEHYVRQPDSRWIFAETADMNETIHLPTIDCDLPVVDVYDVVNIENETDTLNDHHP